MHVIQQRAVVSLDHLNQRRIASLVTATPACSTNAAGYMYMYTRYLRDLSTLNESLAAVISLLIPPRVDYTVTHAASHLVYYVHSSSKSCSKCYLPFLLSDFLTASIFNLFRLNNDDDDDDET